MKGFPSMLDSGIHGVNMKSSRDNQQEYFEIFKIDEASNEKTPNVSIKERYHRNFETVADIPKKSPNKKIDPRDDKEDNLLIIGFDDQPKGKAPQKVGQIPKFNSKSKNKKEELLIISDDADIPNL